MAPEIEALSGSIRAAAVLVHSYGYAKRFHLIQLR
jgi:hypothetical protein